MENKKILFVACTLDGTLEGNQVESIKRHIFALNFGSLEVNTGQGDNERTITYFILEKYEPRFKSIFNPSLNSLSLTPEINRVLKSIGPTSQIRESASIVKLGIVATRKFELQKLIDKLHDVESGKTLIVITNFLLVNYLLYWGFISKVSQEALYVMPGEIAMLGDNNEFDFIRH